jgi:hypothetical protein
MFCHRALGANSGMEHMPVGRRIAFDAAKGRLWIVCRQCQRWNLTAIEERWDAVEEAERLFDGTRLRVSTEQVGLARIREGLELVRIGRPLRPEFAAWRYGDQFGRRRRKAMLIGGGAIAVVGTAFTAGVAAGFVSVSLLGVPSNVYSLWMARRIRARVRIPDGPVVKLKQKQLGEVRLRPDETGGFFVELQSTAGEPTPWMLAGSEAERISALVMTKINSGGAGREMVQKSVREIEGAGGAGDYLTRLVRRPPLPSWLARKHRLEDGIALAGLPPVHRLALEMALHEESERRALQGELKALELAWQAAEEIAAIADDLLLPEDVRAQLPPP